MKLLKKILSFIGLGFVILVGLSFAFINFRSLFAGDFILMNNQFNGFLSCFMRGIYFLSVIGLCVLILIYLIKALKINIVIFVFSVATLLGATYSFAFYEYYVALVLIAIFGIPVLISALNFFKNRA